MWYILLKNAVRLYVNLHQQQDFIETDGSVFPELKIVPRNKMEQLFWCTVALNRYRVYKSKSVVPTIAL